MAKPAKKRLPAKENTVRKVVPVSLITIKDKYKRSISNNLKSKHKDSLSDRVVFEILMQCLKEVPEKEVLKKVPKKYLK